MTFDYLSDIHLEFFRSGSEQVLGKTFSRYWSDVFRSRKGDVLLIAGDVFSVFADHDKAAAFFDAAARRWERVFCVLGNHDYWTTVVFRSVKFSLASTFPKITFLENETAEIDGIRLFGATWWTDINPADEVPVQLKMADYLWTQGTIAEPFSPSLTTKLHRESLAALMKALDDSPEAPFIVLTHHAPSRRSNSRPINILTQAFCADDDRFIESCPQIRVWVHGHVHDPHDYTIGTARILCNPHGYLLRERFPQKDPFRLRHFSL